MRSRPLNSLDASGGAPDIVAVPRQLIRLSRAFAQARVLHSAAEVRLFDLLADGALSEPQIRRRLGLNPVLSRDLLDALAALGLLERAHGRRYRNSTAAAEYLVSGSPSYLGDAVMGAAAQDYPRWGRLTEALLEGRRPDQVGGPGGGEELPVAVPAEADGARTLAGAAVARRLDWLRYADFVHLSGGSGQVAAQVVAVHTHLRGFVVDRPEYRPAFDARMARMGLANRVAFGPGDPLVDPIRETDVVIFGPLRYDLPAATLDRLLARAHGSLQQGGALLLYGALMDDGRRDVFALLDGLGARLASAEATVHAARELRRQVTAAGFAAERILDLDAADEGRILIARKAAEGDR
jgi:hypothetical protein